MKTAVNLNLQLYQKVFSQNAFAMSDHRIDSIFMDQNQHLYQNARNQNVFAANFPTTNSMSVNSNQEIHLQKALATNLANTDFLLMNPNLQLNQNILGQNALMLWLWSCLQKVTWVNWIQTNLLSNLFLLATSTASCPWILLWGPITHDIWTWWQCHPWTWAVTGGVHW